MDNYLMDTNILAPLNPETLSALDRPKPANNINVGKNNGFLSETDREYISEQAVEDVQDQIDEYETEKFKGLVKKWLTHDNNIRKLQGAMREQRKILKELTPKILEFMKSNEIDGLYDNEGGSTLQFKVTKRKETLSQKSIKEKLTAYLKSEDKAMEATNFILSNRAVTDVVNLRRIFNKKSVLKL
jgi:hypothetical protein